MRRTERPPILGASKIATAVPSSILSRAETISEPYTPMARPGPRPLHDRRYRDVLTLSRVALNRMPKAPAAASTIPAISAPWIGER